MPIALLEAVFAWSLQIAACGYIFFLLFLPVRMNCLYRCFLFSGLEERRAYSEEHCSEGSRFWQCYI